MDVLPKQKTPLWQWLHDQKKNYKNKVHIMQNEDIRKEFETLMAEFPKFFRSNEEIWRDYLREVTEFMQKEKRRPNKRKEGEKQLGTWLMNQKKFYKTKTYIMKDEDIRKEFEEFRGKFNI